MKTILNFVFTLFSIGAIHAQIENEKVVFSEKGDFVLINHIQSIDLNNCPFENFLSLKGKKDGKTLIKFKDSIYFEFSGNVKETKGIDSIFCVNNSIQYKNRDTSYVTHYISNRMLLKEFYKEYELNQVGKLINKEIKYKIDNVRDTIFDYSPDSDIVKPYKIDAKIFTLTFYHKERILKKMDLELIFILEIFGKNYINTNKLKKENEKIFISFMKDFKKELNLCINEQNLNNKIIDFKIYNHQKKYYFDCDYKIFYAKQSTLPQEIYIDEAFENGKLKLNADVFYQAVSTEQNSDCIFGCFFILD